MIRDNVQAILKELPENVLLEAAAKTRSQNEVLQAIEAGVTIIGENYVQEAEDVFPVVFGKAKLHFIGHLQRNKVKKAVEIFDVIETVDSLKLAQEIDKRCQAISKTMTIFIEVNSGREEQKFGVFPEDVEPLVKEIATFKHIQITGLMTMGPFTGTAEEIRPYFSETKMCFDQLINLNIPNVKMDWLSMGMTHSYKIAIEEGANIVRIGTKIFGERN